jgi:hypothetical protein
MTELGEEHLMSAEIMQFFSYEHLPTDLQAVSQAFKELAEEMYYNLPANAERTAALRKLLEAKDCAVRAKIYKVV